MIVKTKDLLETIKKDLESKELIISGLDIKESWNKETKQHDQRYYIKTIFSNDYQPALDVKVDNHVFDKVISQNLMHQKIKLNDFVDLNSGVSKTSQYEIQIWFSAKDIIIKTNTLNSTTKPD
jgi:hypothetical protein